MSMRSKLPRKDLVGDVIGKISELRQPLELLQNLSL